MVDVRLKQHNDTQRCTTYGIAEMSEGCHESARSLSRLKHPEGPEQLETISRKDDFR